MTLQSFAELFLFLAAASVGLGIFLFACLALPGENSSGKPPLNVPAVRKALISDFRNRKIAFRGLLGIIGLTIGAGVVSAVIAAILYLTGYLLHG
jgi:hypothetical protein